MNNFAHNFTRIELQLVLIWLKLDVTLATRFHKMYFLLFRTFLLHLEIQTQTVFID